MNKNRAGHLSSLYWQHYWTCHGGFTSVFLMGFFTVTAHSFGLIRTKPLVTPYQSRAGALSLAYNLMMVSAPLVFGMAIGTTVAGDWKEVRNLSQNTWMYSKEFKAVHKELYTYN